MIREKAHIEEIKVDMTNYGFDNVDIRSMILMYLLQMLPLTKEDYSGKYQWTGFEQFLR